MCLGAADSVVLIQQAAWLQEFQGARRQANGARGRGGARRLLHELDLDAERAIPSPRSSRWAPASAIAFPLPAHSVIVATASPLEIVAANTSFAFPHSR